jgi:hypothetical protein
MITHRRFGRLSSGITRPGAPTGTRASIAVYSTVTVAGTYYHV